MSRRVINTLRSPCRDCANNGPDRDQERCTACPRRLEYVAALAHAPEVIGMEKKEKTTTGRPQESNAPAGHPWAEAERETSPREKTCLRCHRTFPLSEGFHRNKRKKDGYQDYCKICRAKMDKARRSKKAAAAGRGKKPAAVQSDAAKPDAVDHPPHYTQHPSGIECIQVTQWMNFCLGNAVKYIWRAGLKGDALEDLKKARRYLDIEIERRRQGHE